MVWRVFLCLSSCAVRPAIPKSEKGVQGGIFAFAYLLRAGMYVLSLVDQVELEGKNGGSRSALLLGGSGAKSASNSLANCLVKADFSGSGPRPPQPPCLPALPIEAVASPPPPFLLSIKFVPFPLLNM